MTNQPLILISGKNDMKQYALAIEQNGGRAVTAYLPEYEDRYDGLLLSGGNDVAPARYGEEVNGAVNPDPDRDEAEFALISRFLAAKKPIFGICRGEQVLNVYFGGTLIQHLPTTERHQVREPGVYHTVCAAPGSQIAALYGDTFSVNSTHHEAVGKMADGFRASFRCPDDGVIEGIEHETLPVFAVQFHPEWLISPDRGNATDGNLLFRRFLAMCQK